MSQDSTKTPTLLRRIGAGYRALALFWTSVCMLLLLFNLGALLLLSVDEQREVKLPPHVEAAMAESYPELSANERKLLRQESRQHMEADPLVIYREQPRSGRFVNIHPAGFRIGAHQGPWPPSQERWNVFFFGGSTAFGYGVPDGDTVPSMLQLELEERHPGRSFSVYNLARGAFYSTQERLQLEKLLTLGPRPDVAILLDGLNDFYFPPMPPPSVAHLTARGEHEARRPWLPFVRTIPIVRLFNLAPVPVMQLVVPTEVERGSHVRAAIERYVANKKIIAALGEAYGVHVLFVWQPVPLYKYDLTQHTFQGNFGGHERSREGYPRMERYVKENDMGDDFLWCADVHERERGVLYMDQVHYNPRGGALLTSCIGDGLEERGLLSIPPSRPSAQGGSLGH